MHNFRKFKESSDITEKKLSNKDYDSSSQVIEHLPCNSGHSSKTYIPI